MNPPKKGKAYFQYLISMIASAPYSINQVPSYFQHSPAAANYNQQQEYDDDQEQNQVASAGGSGSVVSIASASSI